MPRSRGLHRPTLPVRHRLVSFRVTPEEYAALETQAAATHTSISGHIRAAFATLWSETGRRQHRARPTAPEEATARSVTLLGRIYATLQVMQGWAETHPDKADAVALCAHLVAVERALAQVARTLERDRDDRRVLEAWPGQG